jgi:hypothetical protein
LPIGGGPGGSGGGPLSVDLPLWSFLGWWILLVIGNLLVIPAPWTATSYYRWLFPRVHVPQRPNITFTGQVGDIWYVFVAMGLLGYAGYLDNIYQIVVMPLQAALSWMMMRWVVANLSSNGQPIPMTFNGSVWGFIGWQILMFLAVFTIIGWAWVAAAQLRWMCSNIQGTRRAIVFNGSGLGILWRGVVAAILFSLIIPIPWVYRWIMNWTASQTELVSRGAQARM